MSNPLPPINIVHKFRELDEKLIDLLLSLNKEEWQMPTVAKLWKVKDVVAHLLDTNIRILSLLRDQHQVAPPAIQSYKDLVDYLNQLNADWVQAMQRVSPSMLILLHKITGPLYCGYYESLDPFDKAVFNVAWAGEEESLNWMHIARDYTEKFLHQQQIRDAVGKPGLMNKDFFYPFIDIFMLALPHTFKNITAPDNTCLQLTVTSEAGGSWYLIYQNAKWQLIKEAPAKIDSTVNIHQDDAWKLFSKSISPVQVQSRVSITGNKELGEIALTMVSVMA